MARASERQIRELNRLVTKGWRRNRAVLGVARELLIFSVGSIVAAVVVRALSRREP